MVSLSAAERHRANRFPNAITDEDLITFFTLSEEDQKQIPVRAGPHARLRFGLELCALRFMGFVPDDLTSAPPEAVTFVAQQLTVEPEALADYTGSPSKLAKISWVIVAFGEMERSRGGSRYYERLWLMNPRSLSPLCCHPPARCASPR